LRLFPCRWPSQDRHVDPVEFHLARVGTLEKIDASQKRRLARSRRPENDDHVSLGDGNIDAPENLDLV
jgi:hypothetical protein